MTPETREAWWVLRASLFALGAHVIRVGERIVAAIELAGAGGGVAR